MSDAPYKKTLWSTSLSASSLVRQFGANPVAPKPGEALLSWQISPADMELVQRIVERGVELWKSQGIQLDAHLAAMDITACHCNGCPLELLRFLMSDASDFVHDFAGIGVHIDKASGQLRNDFVPTFRKVQA